VNSRAFHERAEVLGFLQLTPVPGMVVADGIKAAAAQLPKSCPTREGPLMYTPSRPSPPGFPGFVVRAHTLPAVEC
jgi:hypothetical protein